jgi:hypothetical protein
MVKQIPILDIGGILISTSILTEYFCCDLTACGGACCIEGDAGAPVTLDEVGEIEAVLDDAWPLMSAQAQAVVDRQGVAYTDPEGELVTSIVGGKDCVFTYYNYPPNTVEELPAGCCLCALERVCRQRQTAMNLNAPSQVENHPNPQEERPLFVKPISCALYPIREKHFAGGLIGLNLHRWSVCDAAFRRGRELQLPVYSFLREPLIRRFGHSWYTELEAVAAEFFKESGGGQETE